jgi:hypothetical protein
MLLPVPKPYLIRLALDGVWEKSVWSKQENYSLRRCALLALAKLWFLFPPFQFWDKRLGGGGGRQSLRHCLGNRALCLPSATQGEALTFKTFQLVGLSLVLIKHNSGISQEEFRLKIMGEKWALLLCALWIVLCVAMVLFLKDSGQWVAQPVCHVLLDAH